MDSQNAEKEIKDFISKSMKAVPKDYFNFWVHGNNKPTKFERIYAYELYHQMRCIQTENHPTEFYINCEVPKGSHPRIKLDIFPGIIIHQPGKDGAQSNLCVIEIKTSCNKSGIEKDFKTIHCMMNCYSYLYGIFIIKGITIKKFCEKAIDSIKSIPHIEEKANNVIVFAQEKYLNKREKGIETCRLNHLLEGEFEKIECL